jgi:hypothetical protein
MSYDPSARSASAAGIPAILRWPECRKFEPKVIDAQVRARLNQKLEESGEKERHAPPL